MIQVYFRVGALLLAVAILLSGHGLQLTLLPMRAEALGWSTNAIALTGSVYFAGFVIGCVMIPSVIARITHIRGFMVLAALATLALLGAGLFDYLGAWLVLRFLTGFALSGLYMVIESWLSDAAPRDGRGRVLAMYSMISLLAMVVGQSFLGLAAPLSLELVMFGAMLLCLSIIPVGLSRMTPPHPLPRTRFSPRVLARASRVAAVCSFFGGLVVGAFWAIGPLVGRTFGLDAGAVGVMMSMGILGGALAQLPVGRLSDRMDRRYVIAGLLIFGTLVSVTGWLFAAAHPPVLYAVMFLIGSTSMPVYALCIAHASDNSDLSLIEIASSILVMNSLGSIVGPLVVAPLIGIVGGSGFFLYAMICLGLGALWTVHRITVIERPRAHERFVTLPRTTAVVAELTQSEPPAPIVNPEGYRRRADDVTRPATAAAPAARSGEGPTG